MGMFDTLHVRYPLPVTEETAPFAAELQGEAYQTKDLACALDVYELRPDGTLWMVGEQPDEEPDSTPRPWVPAAHIVGHVGFYSSFGPEETGWADWRMTIVDGRLHRPIELVRLRAPDLAEAAVRAKRREAWLRRA